MNTHASTIQTQGAKPVHIGHHLREWRQRRHLSQLDLAGDAEISARHLSFVETGRAAPSREMVMRLAERLEVPLRERNVLLVAAGFAPAFPQRTLDDPALKAARQAIDLVLKAHEPNPALAVDRHWNLVSANRMVAPLMDGIPQRLLGQPFNVMRLAFHPEGLAARTVNLAEWCAHLLERLHHQCEATADPELLKLYDDLRAFKIPARSAPITTDGVAIPFKMRYEGEVLSFISTTMVFGTPVDITLSELALETFFPADELTAARMRASRRAWISACFSGSLGLSWDELPGRTSAMSALKPLKIDIVSDVVCPWCYIGKKRIEDALAQVPDVPVEVNWRPFFLNSWVPREGISRDEYLTAKFGSPEAYKGIAGRVVAAAGEEGLTYRPEMVKRQPNTIDCHRLIHWAEAEARRPR